MIKLYSGLPRSGKSYSAVKYSILPALEAGRDVYTNIPLTDLLTRQYVGQIHQFDSQYPVDHPNYFDEIESGAVIVIDEIWRYWPSGLQATKIPQSQKAFFAEHGHKVGLNGFTTEIILVSQDLNQFSKFLRLLIDETFVFRKVVIGKVEWLQTSVYDRAVSAEKPGTKPPKTKYKEAYKSDIFSYYKSHTKNDSDDGFAGVEQIQDTRGNMLNNKYIRYALPISIIVLIVAVSNMGKIFKGSALTNKQDETSSNPNHSQTSIPVNLPVNQSVSQVHSSKPQQPSTEPYPESETLHLSFKSLNGFSSYSVVDCDGRSTEVSISTCSTKYGVFGCVINSRLVTALTGTRCSIEDILAAERKREADLIPSLSDNIGDSGITGGLLESRSPR